MLQATIDIIKMDIEFSEWTALVDIMEHGELNGVRQLLVEFHENALKRRQTFGERLHVLANIEALGFRRFYTHLNPLGFRISSEYPNERTSAYEVCFVNTKFVRKNILDPENWNEHLTRNALGRSKRHDDIQCESIWKLPYGITTIIIPSPQYLQDTLRSV